MSGDHAVEVSGSRRTVLYAFTVFLTSAIVLVLEMTAGRLIAPYVGVSIYTWTSIIGVILAGLSLGNWLGGVWADSGADDVATGITLVVAGLTTLAILLTVTFIAPLIQGVGLNPLSASFLLMLALFFVPAVLLGIVTPLLTTLALAPSSAPGRVIGMMHALAAIGSIAGTFVTGFWLIQYFGTRSVLAAASGLLLVLAVPYFFRKRRPTYRRQWSSSGT